MEWKRNMQFIEWYNYNKATSRGCTADAITDRFTEFSRDISVTLISRLQE